MSPVFASEPWQGLESAPGGGPADVATIQSLESLFKNVVNGVIAIAVVALFVVLLVGGFKFLFSGGDQKKLEMARGTLTNATIGLAVIVIAYLIIKALSTITGVPDILQFKIPTP